MPVVMGGNQVWPAYRAYGTDVTVHRYTAGATDEYGNPAPAWDDGSVLLQRCVLAPKQSTEPDESGRRAVLTGYTVYAPWDANVSAHDRVHLGADPVLWEVVGEVGRWGPHPVTGSKPGCQFDIERVTG